MGGQAPSEAVSTRESVAPSVEEDWATPAMEQEPTQQLQSAIDPQILATEESFSFTQALEDSQPQPSVYPLDGIDGVDGAFATQDADAWLDNMIDNGSRWINNTAEVAPSPPTSMATDTHTALGKIYKACRCLSHQEIYSEWPTYNAELTIAQCMKTCMYCGVDFTTAAELRKHLKRRRYTQRNLSICQETRGKYSSTTPAWTPNHHAETATHQLDARTTRSQSVTNSANGAPRLW
jgi:hypothetical protein